MISARLGLIDFMTFESSNPPTTDLADEVSTNKQLARSYRDAELLYLASWVAATLVLPFLYFWVAEPWWLPFWWGGITLLYAGGRVQSVRMNQRHVSQATRLNYLVLGAALIGCAWAVLLLLSIPLLIEQPLRLGLVASVWLALLILASSVYVHYLRVGFLLVLPGALSLLWVAWTRAPLYLLLFLPPLTALALAAWRNQLLLQRLNHQQASLQALNLTLKQQQTELETRVDERTEALHQALVQQKQATAERDAQRERISQALEASRLALWDWDLLTDDLYHAHFYELFGYRTDEMPLQMRVLGQLVHPEDRPQLIQSLVRCLKGDEVHFHSRFRVRHRSGQWRLLEDHGEVIQREPLTGRALRMLGTRRDITEQQAIEARLSYLTEYDELTGLANRRQFLDRLHQALRQARLHNTSLTLVTFDVDRFKAYNNSLGHEAGDQLLIHVAERLQQVMQQAHILARTGGNEFALLILDQPETEVLTQVEALQRAIYQPVLLDHQEVRLTVSAGLSNYPTYTRELQGLINQADQARLRAKGLGGDRVLVYDEAMHQSSLEQLRLEQDLRTALEQDALEVWYQPKLDLETNQILSAEALARWHHPEQGSISPATFIPLAEKTGLINWLGQQVLHKAIQQAAVWNQAGRPIQVAVNIAAQQLGEGQLIPVIDELLQTYALPSHLLQLELTESTLMEDAQSAIADMQALQQRGISMAIDDFGTGYSSLSYLQRFPLDVLKIDRSFLINAPLQQGQQNLTHAIIALGHSLGMAVVAEGVEEAAQLEELRAMGCDQAQGYAISQPLPTQAFTERFVETPS